MTSRPGPIVVIMGVSGCGKSTVGQALADALGLPFIEGDDYHSPANVAHMAAGHPLTDDHRGDWLRALAARLRVAASSGQGVVMSCSALKRAYRDLLRGQGAASLRLVHLTGDRATLAHRLAERSHHYMPASLLDSQLATLEPPGEDEAPWVFDLTEPVPAIVAAVRQALAGEPSGGVGSPAHSLNL